MKAVIVIDMPTKCSNCLLVEEWFNEYGEKSYYCPLRKASVSKNDDICKKIIPLPQKKGKHDKLHEYDTDIHYEIGWNDCIDEITGETE